MPPSSKLVFDRIEERFVLVSTTCLFFGDKNIGILSSQYVMRDCRVLLSSSQYLAP